jgi:pimeloyl-ACP methyl ester carboxylesterase
MRSPIRAFWYFVVAGLLVAAASLPAYSGSRSSQVYLLSGFAGLSPGFDGLAEKIRKRGIPVSVHNHLMGSALASEIEQKYKRGRRRIILIGQSLGASAVVSLAEQLGKSRIPVRLLVTMDPVVQVVTPRNVRRHLNYYVSDGIGVSAKRGKKSRGALVNLDYKGKPDIGHFSITSSQRVQRQILRSVLAAAG